MQAIVFGDSDSGYSTICLNCKNISDWDDFSDYEHGTNYYACKCGGHVICAGEGDMHEAIEALENGTPDHCMQKIKDPEKFITDNGLTHLVKDGKISSELVIADFNSDFYLVNVVNIHALGRVIDKYQLSDSSEDEYKEFDDYDGGEVDRWDDSALYKYSMYSNPNNHVCNCYICVQGGDKCVDEYRYGRESSYKYLVSRLNAKTKTLNGDKIAYIDCDIFNFYDKSTGMCTGHDGVYLYYKGICSCGIKHEAYISGC